jgi:hypothetical protein
VFRCSPGGTDDHSFDFRRRLIRARETGHADVAVSNGCVQLLMRSFVSAGPVIVSELNEVQLYFRIGRAPREIEVGRGLTPVVIEIGHLEHLF